MSLHLSFSPRLDSFLDMSPRWHPPNRNLLPKLETKLGQKSTNFFPSSLFTSSTNQIAQSEKLLLCVGCEMLQQVLILKRWVSRVWCWHISPVATTWRNWVCGWQVLRFIASIYFPTSLCSPCWMWANILSLCSQRWKPLPPSCLLLSDRLTREPNQFFTLLLVKNWIEQ